MNDALGEWMGAEVGLGTKWGGGQGGDEAPPVYTLGGEEATKLF